MKNGRVKFGCMKYVTSWNGTWTIRLRYVTVIKKNAINDYGPIHTGRRTVSPFIFLSSCLVVLVSNVINLFLEPSPLLRQLQSMLNSSLLVAETSNLFLYCTNCLSTLWDWLDTKSQCNWLWDWICFVIFSCRKILTSLLVWSLVGVWVYILLYNNNTNEFK